MAEIDFYLSDDDQKELIAFVLSKGLWLLPDIHYDTPQPTRVTTLEQYTPLNDNVRQFFIVGEDYLRQPVSMRRVETEESGFYYIFPQDGGPVIGFIRSALVRRILTDEGEWLHPGSLYHFPWYFNPITHTNEKPMPPLVSAYKQIANWVRAHATRVKPGVRAYWISRNAQTFVKRGCGLVGLEQFDLTFE